MKHIIFPFISATLLFVNSLATAETPQSHSLYIYPTGSAFANYSLTFIPPTEIILLNCGNPYTAQAKIVEATGDKMPYIAMTFTGDFLNDVRKGCDHTYLTFSIEFQVQAKDTLQEGLSGAATCNLVGGMTYAPIQRHVAVFNPNESSCTASKDSKLTFSLTNTGGFDGGEYEYQVHVAPVQ